MGLIKAAIGAAGGTLADQWEEFYTCDSLDADILVARGVKVSTGRSSNKKGNDNVISNGSGIAVADGQCMMIVQQGEVTELCAEPGQYTFDNSLEPSIFAGSLGKGVADMFKSMTDRFKHGGDAALDQRIYYFNIKEIMDNKFGTANPLLFRIVDKNINFDRDVSVRCNGIYSYNITNPMIFYKEVCGNVDSYFDRSEIDMQLKSEFIAALQPAFGKLSALGLRPSDIPAHAGDLEDAMNEVLTKKWSEKRGITVKSVAMNPITLKDEDLEMLQKFQDRAVLKDRNMAAATLAEAQAAAMEKAAENPNGAMMGFMGMSMAGVAGGLDANELYKAGNAEVKEVKREENVLPEWTCSCGTLNTGKFCTECGSPKPASNGWVCSCGAVNKGKFCSECGKPKPAGALLYRCDKCGWEPEDPAHPPKFCPECGDPFDKEDIKKE